MQWRYDFFATVLQFLCSDTANDLQRYCNCFAATLQLLCSATATLLQCHCKKFAALCSSNALIDSKL
ncbi:hypothetical protein DW096_10335 [Bacteroides sp. AM07-18]|uniref:Uncharacterized protein n=2 Tax=Bacteroides uniformis TaxID=820 RepID=A0A374MWI1_BACUN|nr:hypothetical protein BACUNI_03828 [Bacteroides uniformis ATCC 8492]RGD53416.1 hypothetical protein DW096_10335 [Bacteroides sp. AM07-18]RGI75814.1 hypothetical protein DXD90_11200 [Bacteroides uniformis]RJU29300.1 hypothetical protein DW995_04260 [Bacteroides sp. AM51-7]RJU34440.1 hypothetical protein DW947_12465 [Bacteroides sp. AM44-19]RJU76550.1 hypothetical protein DW699_10330 [Bacteroides sp. AM26-2]RJV42486.1 hypothetical protein DWX62_01135 [Bacteroides sp. AF20-13LB]